MNRIVGIIFLRSIIVAGALLTTFSARGQYENHLIIKKNGWKNKEHFLTGDEITLKRSRSGPLEQGFIQGIGTREIVLAGQVIPVEQIGEVVRFRTGFNFEASGKTLMIAAPGFLAISAINAFIWDIRPVWSASNLTTSAILLVSGLILPAFQEKHYRIGKRFSLHVVQSDPYLQGIK